MVSTILSFEPADAKLLLKARMDNWTDDSSTRDPALHLIIHNKTHTRKYMLSLATI